MPNLYKKWYADLGDDAKNKLAAAYRGLFSSAEGRIVLAHILDECGVFQAGHESTDPLSTKFSDGRRRAALEILNWVNSTPEQYQSFAISGEIDDLFINGENQ